MCVFDSVLVVGDPPYVPRGTEAIPRVRCLKPQGSELMKRTDLGDLTLIGRWVPEFRYINHAPDVCKNSGVSLC